MKFAVNRIKNVLRFFTKNKIKNKGANNSIKWDDSLCLNNTHISIYGNNNLVVFGKDCFIRGLRLTLSGDGNIIEIGDMVSINGNSVKPTTIQVAGGKKVSIGKGSLISNNIEIHTTDNHAIYNRKGDRINLDKDIRIGKYVWIGMGTHILKGSEIGNGCVVGAGSIVAGKYTKENVILAGTPLRIIRENIFWSKGTELNATIPQCLKDKWGDN